MLLPNTPVRCAQGGHIPGARNVPFPSVVAPGGSLKPADELKAVFSAAGADLDGAKPLVATCGSGLTACVLALAVFKATGKLVGWWPPAAACRWVRRACSDDDVGCLCGGGCRACTSPCLL
jgi:hypothetical protein